MKGIAEESMGLKEVKPTEKPKTYTENIKTAADKMSEVSDKIVSALEKNSEATNKNTNAKTGGASTEEKAFGGYIQKFAEGGRVKQVFAGGGDVQPAMLTAGEEVLTKEQRELIKARAKFEDLDTDAKMKGNIAKFGLLGVGALGAGAYALKGYKKPENASIKDSLVKAKGTIGKQIKDFSLADKVKNMDKRIFANPFANLKTLPEDLRALKDVGGKGFGAGAASACKLGMKSAGWMGAGLTLGFAANRFR